MFTDTTTEVTQGQELCFDYEQFEAVKNDYNSFVDTVIEQNNLDPCNIAPSWNRSDGIIKYPPLNRSYLHVYDIPTYYNLQIADRLLNGVDNPRILEIGSYSTGLFPAMYLSSKGFKSDVMDVYSIELAFKELSKIAKSYGVSIHHSNWIHPHNDIVKNKFDIIYVQSIPYYFFDEYDENRLGENTYNMLSDNGVFMCSGSNHTDLDTEFPNHFRRISKWYGRNTNLGDMYSGSRIGVYRKK